MKKAVLEELKAAGMAGAEAEKAFDYFCDAATRLLERGERVRLPNIGTLARVKRAETRRRNPRTGEIDTIAARETVALRNPRRF